MTDTLLIDCAWTKPTAAAIKKAGYTGVVGYISHDSGKDLSADQAKTYRAAGLMVGFVFETPAGRAAEGKAAGAADRVFAEGQAKTRGYPPGCVIFYAVDFDAAPAIIQPYFDGIGAGVTYPSGAYGSLRVVDSVLAAGTVRYGWQTVAWSGSAVSDRAHLYQRSKKSVPLIGGVASNAYDEDVLLRPLPLWGAKSAPKPKPPPKVKPFTAWQRALLRRVTGFLNARHGADLTTDDRKAVAALEASALAALGRK